jgi:hypothetical protein
MATICRNNSGCKKRNPILVQQNFSWTPLLQKPVLTFSLDVSSDFFFFYKSIKSL